MEGFTEHIQRQLQDILDELEPRINTQNTREKLEVLFTDIGIHEDAIYKRAVQQLTDILQQYQQGLTATYEQTKASLFKLVAQLEYPSRQ
jgi:hypothetical protein